MANLFQTRQIWSEQTKNTNRFTLVFDNLDQVLQKAATSPITSIKNRYNSLQAANLRDNFTASQVLELSLLSLTFPNVEIGRQDIHRFNDSIKALTKFEPTQEMQVTFYDYINGSASSILYSWYALLGDKFTGAIGFKEDYALGTASMYVYGPDAPAYDDTQIAEGWFEHHQFVNLYPVSIDLGEHSYENGEARKITCQFAFDNIYPVEYRGRV